MNTGWLFSKTALVGAIIATLCAWSVLNTAQITDRVANKLLANANAPGDREPPPTAFTPAFSSQDVRHVGGHGLGLDCSIPSFLETWAFPSERGEAPVSLQMRQACVYHDYCYRHGAATYGYSQSDCDYLLLEHSYRICRFVYSKSPEICVSRARKVTLGVRIGGNEHFKRVDRAFMGVAKSGADKYYLDDKLTSSYLEFDPYPVRSSHYFVYRLADAPQAWRNNGYLPRALYTFSVKPAGVNLWIVGWNLAGDTICTAYSLPGQPNFLTTAPQVGRIERSDSTDEDWFVWWHRYGLDSTGGKFTLLAPGRASLKDWQHAFPGAQAHEPTRDCNDDEPVEERISEMPVGVAAAEVLTGWGGDEDDSNFSEFDTTASLERWSKGLGLIALRTHSCVKGSNVLCLTAFHLTPGGARHQPQEPLVVRDVLNRNGRGGEQDRYRNFATAPMVIAGSTGPALAWIRRGRGKLGDGYRTEAYLRRLAKDGRTSASLGLVRLENFPERAEPVFVVDRNTEQPRLVSLIAEGGSDGGVQIRQWRLPPAVNASLSTENDALSISPVDLGEKCTSALNASWLIRAPIVIASDADRWDLLLHRMAVIGRDRDIVLMIRLIRLTDETCKVLVHSESAVLGRVPMGPEGRSAAIEFFASLRTRPLLVTEQLLEDTVFLVLPDPEEPYAPFIAQIRF